VADGVRQQVVEDAFDLVRRDGCGCLAVDVGLEADAASGGLRLEQANGGFDELGDARLLQLEAEDAGVDACELEQVVDEQRRVVCAGRGSPTRLVRVARRRSARCSLPSR
jgi:hypothetical protein